MDVGQAMIYRCIDETHRQPLAMRSSINVDSDSNLHFSVESEFEKKHCDSLFPVELFFYKKGKPFYVTVKGMAKSAAGDSDVSIKMNEVEYCELTDPAQSGWKRMMKGVTNIQAVL